MTNSKFVRSSDLVVDTPLWDWISWNMPGPREGVVVGDVDMIYRIYNPAIKNDDGKFILIELKQNGARMGIGQKHIYKLLDGLLRKGDPEADHYKGFYVMSYDENGEKVEINYKHSLNMDEFKEFLMGTNVIDPYPL